MIISNTSIPKLGTFKLDLPNEITFMKVIDRKVKNKLCLISLINPDSEIVQFKLSWYLVGENIEKGAKYIDCYADNNGKNHYLFSIASSK